MLSFSYWMSLTPVVAPLLASVYIPVACKTGSVVQRALYLYDAQPTPSAHSGPKFSWTVFLFSTLGLATFLALCFPPPSSWRSSLAFQLVDHLRVLIPTLLLFGYTFLLGCAIAAVFRRRSGEERQDLLVSRLANGDARTVIARPIALTRLDKRCIFAASMATAFWLLPPPQNYGSFQPMEMPRIPDHKAFIAHYIGVATGFTLLLGGATTNPHNLTGSSLLSLNFFPLATWAYSLVLATVFTALNSSDSDKEPKAKTDNDNWMNPDGILETVCLLSHGPLLPFAMLLVMPLFTFLYRYEEAEQRQRSGITAKYGIELASCQHAYADTVPAEEDAQKLVPVADGAPKPVSLRRAASLAPGLRFCQSGITRTIFLCMVGIQLATFSGARKALSHSTFDLWTETKVQMPLINPLPWLSVPVLSLVAFLLARNNQVSLWKYREDWSAPKADKALDDGDDGKHARELTPGQGEKEGDHLLADGE